MPIIKLKKSIIPSCDVDSLEKLSKLVRSTCSVRGVGAYKIGFELVIPFGMEKVVKTAILSAIQKTIDYIKEEDQLGLRELSDIAIKNAEIYRDEDSTTIAVITYSISKIIQASRCDVDKKICNINPELRSLQNELSSLYKNLEKENFTQFNRSIRNILDMISNIDKKLNLYIEEVLSRSQIKKGGTIYSSGISLSQSAQILGINNWQLMNYVGKSEIISTEDEGVDIRARLKFARGLFE